MFAIILYGFCFCVLIGLLLQFGGAVAGVLVGLAQTLCRKAEKKEDDEARIAQSAADRLEKRNSFLDAALRKDKGNG